MIAATQAPGLPIARLKAGPGADSLARLCGEAPAAVSLQRTLFPGRRPVQLHYLVHLRSGRTLPVLAEHHPGAAALQAARISASLAKSRHGQGAGLARWPIVADEATGLVLRRPGLDERLPGLRLLHDRDAARGIVAALTGRDPGPVGVRLLAHRLGKRAVLAIDCREAILYARLRPTKSGDGAGRLGRHRRLWAALGTGGALRIPEPLGAHPGLGLSLFAALPGSAPDFRRPETAPLLARALAQLRAAPVAGLPRHRGADEARILTDWLERCRRHLPEAAAALGPSLTGVADRLAALGGDAAPCHRDLHEAQILISDAVAGLLDFDTASLADPALDPGNLLAHLFLAGQPETRLRATLDLPGLALWRRAALLRLAMIYAFTSMPAPAWRRLAREACRDHHEGQAQNP